jgi:hypothetical protein
VIISALNAKGVLMKPKQRNETLAGIASLIFVVLVTWICYTEPLEKQVSTLFDEMGNQQQQLADSMSQDISSINPAPELLYMKADMTDMQHLAERSCLIAAEIRECEYRIEPVPPLQEESEEDRHCNRLFWRVHEWIDVKAALSEHIKNLRSKRSGAIYSEQTMGHLDRLIPIEESLLSALEETVSRHECECTKRKVELPSISWWLLHAGYLPARI